MTKGRKLTDFQVAQIVNSEGLASAVHNYMDGENINSSELKKLWKRAREAISDIEDYFVEKLGEEWQDIN